MIELATEDCPAILCLQEVPVGVPHLAGWSGMEAYWLVARGPDGRRRWRRRLRAFATGSFGRASPGRRMRSSLTDRSRGTDLGGVQISDNERERRIVHAVRVDGDRGDRQPARVERALDVVLPELERARAFVDALAASRRGAHPRGRLQPRTTGARRLRDRRARHRSHPGRRRGRGGTTQRGHASDASSPDASSPITRRSSGSSAAEAESLRFRP